MAELHLRTAILRDCRAAKGELQGPPLDSLIGVYAQDLVLTAIEVVQAVEGVLLLSQRVLAWALVEEREEKVCS
jgi:hypothetical protein